MAITPYLLVSLLVFVRILGMVSVAPLLGAVQIPNLYKIGFSLFLAQVVVATLSYRSLADHLANIDMQHFVFYIIQESLVGFALGFVVTVMFAVVTFAGQLLDIQVGFSIANLISPGMTTPSGLLSNFHYIIFSLLFIGSNGLSTVVLALLESFKYLPLGVARFHGSVADVFLQSVTSLTLIGIQMAAPVLLATFLTNVALAAASRMVPQMNVFVVGFPAILFVGLLLLGLMMPGMVYLMNNLISTLDSQFAIILRALGGSVP